MLRLVSFFPALLSLLALAACKPQVPAPDPAPQQPRIVALSPAVAIILRDVGAASLIVGRHDFDAAFTHLPAAGHQGALDYETLLALAPTHIIIEWGSRDLPPRLTSLAARHDWHIHNVRLLTLDDILAVTDDMHARFAPDPAAEPPSIALAAAWAPHPRPLAPLGRVLLLGATDPPAALGPGSCHHQILQSLGATPAITAGSPWIELDHEDLLALAPDTIIIVKPRTASDQAANATQALGPIASLRLPAIAARRVALLDGPNHLIPSTAMADFARDLARALDAMLDAGVSAP